MYQATNTQPHHVSVGAIAWASGKALVHRDQSGAHRMMTGTLEDGESPAQCLHRELLEEFGATCRIDAYVGATVTQVTDDRGTWQKVTLWHRVTVLSLGAPRVSDLDCDIVQVAPEDLQHLVVAADRWPDAEMLRP